jgi:hypothetical protein
MKIVTNTKLINRNAKIGQYTSIGALVVLAAGLYISFKYPDKFIFSMGCLLGGFLLSQIGMYFGNRWGRHPRPDEILEKSLKGLGREYTLYNFTTPVSHLLVGPAGVWILLPYDVNGVVTYEKNRWRVKGGGFAQGYLRLFGQDNMGRPDLESETETASAKKYLKRVLPEGIEIPNVHTALLFPHPKVELKLENAPLPALTPKDLKDFLRSKGREEPISEITLEAIRKALPQPNKEE